MAQEINPDEVSVLALAYVGDSFYELIVRTNMLMEHNVKSGDLNKLTKQFTNAQAQSKIADLLADHLTEEEFHVYKRGRNAKGVSAPHSCTVGEYRKATGLEALLGYLYLNREDERAIELIVLGIRLFKNS